MESRLLGRPTIRHKHCERIIERDTLCPPCKGHRNSLHAIYSRIEKCKEGKENCVNPHSHVYYRYRYLTSPEKTQRLSALHQAARTAQQQVRRLKARLEEQLTTVGEIVDEPTHAGLESIMEDSESIIHDRFPPESFGRIFWDQQKEATQASTPSSIRLMIKWCLHLRHLSSSSYEAL